MPIDDTTKGCFLLVEGSIEFSYSKNPAPPTKTVIGSNLSGLPSLTLCASAACFVFQAVDV